jgi:hypothetical protein
VLRTGSVRAVALTAYDPDCDAEGRMPPIANRLLTAVADVAARRDGLPHQHT